MMASSKTATRFADHRGRKSTAEIAVRSSASSSTSHRGYNSIVRYRIDLATYLRSVIEHVTDGCAAGHSPLTLSEADASVTPSITPSRYAP
jgi:hypothetical protein